MHGEQRLIIATCEKGLVEDVNDMKDIKAGLDEIKDKHPNFVDMAAHEVFRPVNREECGRSDSDGEILEQGGQRAHSADAEPQEASRRHSARAEHLYLRAAVQRYLESLGVAAGEHHLLRLHQFRSVPRRSEPRRHRSLLSRRRSAFRTFTT